MFWADQTRDDTAEFLRSARAKWDSGEEFAYVIIGATDDRVLGGGGLHRRLGPRRSRSGPGCAPTPPVVAWSPRRPR